ncbi:hypothetical protein Rhe02_04840 [Rhizocola hellebori]|uniref:DUF998 domain-containing protein n=1 Tax=Rhizocola hellebori TaxID=1392758 RepID=A0A8J3Q2U8_9ACTN|nr:hypothetical protein [Rhizocola hellebori]GIH02417.1 hypothetical protein Rhe02_04840 [Rhizocola hellebori]
MSRRIGAVIGLLLLAPFIGEFLLGNVTADMLAYAFLFIPLYGCGAVLVRELGRRTGSGWPGMALLAVAYALIEEGPVDQLLWNDSYAGHDYLAGPSYLPALGMSVELTQTIVALHAVWSICVPIAIVETFEPSRQPWLGRIGLTVVGLVFALGAGLVFWGNYAEEHFLATPAQLIWITVVIVAFIVAAFQVRRLPRRPVAGVAPSPWVAFVLALVLTTAFWGPMVLVTAQWYEWVGVAVWCAVAGLGLAIISRWSRQQGWNQRHIFALGAGATMTYLWLAFPLRPELGGSLALDLATNTGCALVALTVLGLAWRSLRRHEQTTIASAAEPLTV